MNTTNLARRWACSIDADLNAFDKQFRTDSTAAWMSTNGTIILGSIRQSDNDTWLGILFVVEQDRPLASIIVRSYRGGGRPPLQTSIEQYKADNPTHEKLSNLLAGFLYQWVNDVYGVKPEPVSTKPVSFNDYEDW